VKLANFVGVWQMAEFNEQGDSIGAFQLVATTDTSGWHTVVPNRPPIQRRVVSFGGDSVVNEIGPFESVLRPGVSGSHARGLSHPRGFATWINHSALLTRRTGFAEANPHQGYAPEIDTPRPLANSGVAGHPPLHGRGPNIPSSDAPTSASFSR
jgi:hypothetical protein